MRKSIFLMTVLSLCVADSVAFAATSQRENARSAAGASVPAAPVSARATTRQRVVSTPTTVRPETSASKAVVNRAATKKALSMGTKVATATENTAVSLECQEAYYGCMDAFCMLDNASGGRCQCSDRVDELNEALDEILRVDEQSTRLATEGVEKVQMGEFADQINAKAAAIQDEIDKSSSKTASDSSPNLIDLTKLVSDSLFEDEEYVFGSEETDDSIQELLSKKGDALQQSAARMCSLQIPEECQSSLTFLKLAYVQKVKSDCTGYENALRQQKISSQQKLLAAQKAVREAVLTDVREKNRYGTTGECAIAFAKCMQTTAECGTDYTGCVTLAAAENVKNNKSGTKAKQTKIKGVVSGADITLAASTMEALLAKKEICASVTKQCVNSNKNDEVWSLFLRNAAPALKSAELIAEQNLRSNCLPAAAECFKNACKSQFAEDDESYDACLSSPATYKSLCKVQLEPCLEATGGSYDNPESSSLWNGLIALLNAMKVDACTKEIKDCLTERCGKDYSGCVGLDTYSIGNLCPVDKLTACVSDGKYADGTGGTNTQAIREYVAEIGQGLALQIDNELADACQNAANDAMIKVCGDTESCDVLADSQLITQNPLTVRFCRSGSCVDNVEAIQGDSSVVKQYTAQIVGADKIDFGKLEDVNDSTSYLSCTDPNSTRKADKLSNLALASSDRFGVAAGASPEMEELVTRMNTVYKTYMSKIASDNTVRYCVDGREVPGFAKDSKIGSVGENERFPCLVSSMGDVIADHLISNMLNEFGQRWADAEEIRITKTEELIAHIKTLEKEEEEKRELDRDINNEKACQKWAKNAVFGIKNGTVETSRRIAEYDMSTNTCKVTIDYYYCKTHAPIRRKGCRKWNYTPGKTETVTHVCNGSDPSSACGWSSGK